MEQMANRAQTIAADALIAAGAFFLAYLLSSGQFLDAAIPMLPTLELLQLIGIYTALAALFSALFRRELSPWRYVSIPDAMVLARTAFLTAPDVQGLLEGGVPIMKDGFCLGAVGVSGVKSTEDAQIAKAGIAALGL